eukprot:7293140-Pyramimonas_sp.AAC.1
MGRRIHTRVAALTADAACAQLRQLAGSPAARSDSALAPDVPFQDLAPGMLRAMLRAGAGSSCSDDRDQ